MNKVDKAIQEELAPLKKERETLLKSVSKQQAQLEKLQVEMNEAQTAYYNKVKEIRAVTHPRLYDLDMEIAALTRKLSTNKTPVS